MYPYRYLHQLFGKLILSYHLPDYTSYIRTLKTPQHPKVVIFGNSERVYELINKQFLGFKHVNGVEFEHKEDFTSAGEIANNLIQAENGYDLGSLVTDYPTNLKQAERLDVLIDGVNLALYLKDPTDQVTQQRHQEAIQYYQKTGALVEFQIDPQENLEEQAKKLQILVTNEYKH
ncbi:hypothetical protein IMG5_190710 [Ichthyophthirius multifiliis]|uniref:Uncharacterized protein n=1 Tax=Ichthyophthirius multifiliis TaxID=5932 RepID=G0R4A4_ICHMU|nr:hypothetical protein IMG5_190710 [Ichthyophthirius multifiliis]EGR27715.1 hypothetical protein IMG5_190710 [Ichthyophthirius multifiliis]|eukprot:XP_004025167.1 hypothetical protein IMG5_190710 [Ichthyophthirius multifiliis]